LPVETTATNLYTFRILLKFQPVADLEILYMNKIDHLLQKFQYWIRSKSLLYRFTLGTRILLAIGFIPTGLVKLLGHRFSSMSIESDVGAFFEILYQSGLYWNFLGFTQILAGVMVLIPATSAVGALLFFGIILNIFVITISYDFAYTPVITSQMLLASIWLIIWDYDRFRGFLFNQSILSEINESGNLSIASKPSILPQPVLKNSFERGVYITGAVAGLLFFGVLRGLNMPSEFIFILLTACIICFITAIILGIRNARS
tara:strand:+ start:27497 stop:28276 length:780 start_codon:yes stop_codon:yes gene_type:complete